MGLADLLDSALFEANYRFEDDLVLMPLAVLIKQARKDLLPKLLHKGLDLSQTLGSAQVPPLLFALINKSLEWVDILLKAQAQTQQYNKYAWSAAMYAAFAFADDSALQLKLGALSLKAQDQNLVDLFRTLDQGDDQALALLLAAKPSLKDSLNAQGQDLLQALILQFDEGQAFEFARLNVFLEARWDFSKTYLAHAGDSPDSLCINRGHYGLLEELCRQGLQVNDSEGQCNSFLYRVYAQDFERIKCLLEAGANPHSTDADGSNALYMLSYNDKPQTTEIFRYLQAYGIAVDAQGYGQQTPLYE